MLIDEYRDKIKLMHRAPSTFAAYWPHVHQFLLFFRRGAKWIHPREMGTPEVTEFLTHLAVKRQVSASTQNQALSAILFLYRYVLGIELTGIDAVRAKTSRYVPTVMSRQEVRAVLSGLKTPYLLMAQLMYGAGLRLDETMSLRIKDIDFDRRQLHLKTTKGSKPRLTILPPSLIEPIQKQMEQTRILHESDIRTIQELMGHEDIATTEIYLHVRTDGVTSTASPLESLVF